MEQESTRNLSKGQKIALWFALFWLVSSIFGGLNENWIILVVVSIALIAAVYCVFKNIIDAKHAWTVFAVSIILPSIIIGILDDSKDINDKESVVKKETKAAVASDKSTKNESDAAKEEKSKESSISPREKEIAEAGRSQGALFGAAGANNNEFSAMLDMADLSSDMEDKVNEMLEEMAGGEYDKEYGSPSNAEEEKLKKIYIENFIEAMNNTMDALGD